MRKHSKLIGGTLLIVGTSIGGGMLALPVTTAELGFTHSLFFLVLCWLIMTSGALLILEVNLRLPSGSNIISMARATLGLPGQIIAWFSYLILLYTLLSGYIAGGSDVFSGLLAQTSLAPPHWLTATLFTLLFAGIVYQGIHSVDYVNRGLMLGKLGIYVLLLALIGPHVSGANLKGGSVQAFVGTLMILISSFGFASIVPSLRVYFDEDLPSLRRVIILGSLIPLLCYILWDAVIMGVVAREGDNSLMSLMHTENTITGLTFSLTQALNNQWIGPFFSFFTSICMLTAFLGVSLGLFDFLADGLSLNKARHQKKYVLLLTFLPPLVIVLFNPGIYIKAFSYAGICCVVLLLLLPVVMAWKSRANTVSALDDNHLVPGGSITLSLIGLVSLGLLMINFI